MTVNLLRWTYALAIMASLFIGPSCGRTSPQGIATPVGARAAGSSSVAEFPPPAPAPAATGASAVAASASAAAASASAEAASGAAPADADAAPSQTGWRQESSLGVEISVPADWTINDYDCPVGDTPTVVRGLGAMRLCGRAEKPTKQIARILAYAGTLSEKIPSGSGFTSSRLSIGGVAAERTEGLAPDGRYAGWLTIPSRKVLVAVRVSKPEIARRILDSARLVDTDHNGCSTIRPARLRPNPPRHSTDSGMMPADTKTIAICNYSEGHRLASSARLTGADARKLVDELNRASPGPNPDNDPKKCLHETPRPPVEVVLFAGEKLDGTAVYVTYSGCTGRRLDNGARLAHVTRSVLRVLMESLHAGYAFMGNLPS